MRRCQLTRGWDSNEPGKMRINLVTPTAQAEEQARSTLNREKGQIEEKQAKEEEEATQGTSGYQEAQEKTRCQKTLNRPTHGYCSHSFMYFVHQCFYM